jgi:hypothetical protein
MTYTDTQINHILNTPFTIECFPVDKKTYQLKKEMIDNQINNLENARKECLSKIAEVKDNFLRLVPATYLFPKGEPESYCKNLS